MNSDTIDQFEQWLADHYDPERTAAGRTRMQKGVPVYPRDAHQELQKLLGGSFGAKAIRKARAGEQVPARLRGAIETLVELDDVDAILAHRRDQKWLESVRHARHIHSLEGKAPDGGDLEAWVRRQKNRLDDVYDTDAPLDGEAAEVWAEICLPAANRTRRQRRAA